jgi:two-component system cell cycle sensor histidine kinase/response regulator CckA
MGDTHGATPKPPQIRILHLEDNARDAELIKHRLQSGGIAADIQLATSREEFADALNRDGFDLVLCDYNLPGYDGISALQLARHVRPDASVIMISGSVGEDEAVKCLQSGATDYLLKQRLDRLVPAVSRALKDADDRRSRMRTEAALQERERRLSSIFEAVDDMLFYIEVEAPGTYRMVSVNPAFVATTGLQTERVIGKTFDAVFPAPQLGMAHFAQAIREKRVVRWEETFELPAGRRTGEISVTPVFDDRGRCTHLVGAVHDITARRQLEAQFRQAQKMESVGQLAGGIAHDFNNLLTVINGVAELALEKAHEGSRDGVEADLAEIRLAGERAAGLTRQLLAFSRKQIMRPQVMNLSAVVSEMAKMLHRLLGEDVELTISATDPAFVHADRGQVEQVIANLAVNARDAMPHGGALAIEVNSETIGEEGSAIAERGRFVTLTVRDTGTGMDEDIRRQIFEPFFTTKGPAKGTGLGLSTVYGIVKQSNGYIRVDSEAGRGTRFTIYLPQVEDAAAAAPESVPAESGGTETVLIVEDVIGVRHLMTRVLESGGYTVLSAGSGVEAIAMLEGYPHRVDLLITDVVMPGMSGRELAERVAAMRPDLQFLYMSGYTDDVVLRHIVLEQGTPFISKPFTKAQLLSMIRQLLTSR